MHDRVVRFASLSVFAATLSLGSAAAPAAATPFFGDRPATAGSTVNFLVHLPLRDEAGLRQLVELQSDPTSAVFHHFLKPAQFRAAYGPTPATVAQIEAALRTHGFVIGTVNTQILEAHGSAATVERTFGIRLGMSTDDRGTRFGSYDAVKVPADLASLGIDIIGLAAIPRPQPQYYKAPQNRYFDDGPYWFTDLKQAYSYPSYAKANGSSGGKHVVIVTVGDSDYSTSDAQSYFGYEGLRSGGLAPTPPLYKLLFKPYNSFNPNNGASGEANLDIQQAGGSAPEADIVGAAAPNNVNENFLTVYSYLADNEIGDVISTSYGSCELLYTAAYAGSNQTSVLADYNKVFVQGNSEGQTYVVSSGDLSGLPCPPPAYFTSPNQKKTYVTGPGVMAHADDPNVVAVGGTNLMTTFPSSNLASNYVSESEFYDLVGKDDKYGTGNYLSNELWGSGSGVSKIFARPSYQNGFVTASGRSNPDVAMNMGSCLGSSWVCNNPAAGSTDVEVVAGQLEQVGGTSAAAPEFAGLLGLFVVLENSDLGDITPYMYNTMAKANSTKHYFRQDIPGSNGVVEVPSGHSGYSQVTGLGSPIGVNFLGVPSDPLAGNPRTSTNP